MERVQIEIAMQQIQSQKLTIKVRLLVQWTQHLLLRGPDAFHLPLDLVQHLLLVIVAMGNLLLPQALDNVRASASKQQNT